VDLGRIILEDILMDVRGQVAAVTGMPPDRVLPLARPQQRVPVLVGDMDILLRFRGFRSQYPDHRDRHDLRLVHRLEVIVRTRYERDSVDKDTLWLIDPAKGNIPAWRKILDGLQNFIPLDGQSNTTVEPLYVLDGDDGETNAADPGWGSVVLTFGCVVEEKLTLRQPGDSGWVARTI